MTTEEIREIIAALSHQIEVIENDSKTLFDSAHRTGMIRNALLESKALFGVLVNSFNKGHYMDLEYNAFTKKLEEINVRIKEYTEFKPNK